MPHRPSFAFWLSRLFGHSESQVRQLLKDETALHFLIAWSLLESKCFGGYMNANNIEAYAKNKSTTLDLSNLRNIGSYFHGRYQNKNLFNNLMHAKKIKKIKPEEERLVSLLGRPYSELTAEDVIFFITFVIYRYRNNIFHGNKGVTSWLMYREQIQFCIQVMQVMISDAEQATPTMIDEAA
jgi:hypothetical protein